MRIKLLEAWNPNEMLRREWPSHVHWSYAISRRFALTSTRTIRKACLYLSNKGKSGVRSGGVGQESGRDAKMGHRTFAKSFCCGQERLWKWASPWPNVFFSSRPDERIAVPAATVRPVRFWCSRWRSHSRLGGSDTWNTLNFWGYWLYPMISYYCKRK